LGAWAPPPDGAVGGSTGAPSGQGDQGAWERLLDEPESPEEEVGPLPATFVDREAEGLEPVGDDNGTTPGEPGGAVPTGLTDREAGCQSGVEFTKPAGVSCSDGCSGTSCGTTGATVRLPGMGRPPGAPPMRGTTGATVWITGLEVPLPCWISRAGGGLTGVGAPPAARFAGWATATGAVRVGVATEVSVRWTSLWARSVNPPTPCEEGPSTAALVSASAR
jgi:hypothetical protein